MLTCLQAELQQQLHPNQSLDPLEDTKVCPSNVLKTRLHLRLPHEWDTQELTVRSDGPQQLGKSNLQVYRLDVALKQATNGVNTWVNSMSLECNLMVTSLLGKTVIWQKVKYNGSLSEETISQCRSISQMYSDCSTSRQVICEVATHSSYTPEHPTLSGCHFDNSLWASSKSLTFQPTSSTPSYVFHMYVHV